MHAKTGTLNSLLRGAEKLFGIYGGNAPRSREEINARLRETLGAYSYIWYDNAEEALASDWQKVGNDMREVMKREGLTP